MTAPTSNSCVRAFAEMRRLVTVILTGDDWRKYERGRNLYFILMCRDQSPNRPMPEFHGYVIFAFAPEIECISGPSMGGLCHRASQLWRKYIQPFGATAFPAMAGIPISMTLTLLRNGCTEVILTAA